jgi:hypothetical protein
LAKNTHGLSIFSSDLPIKLTESPPPVGFALPTECDSEEKALPILELYEGQLPMRHLGPLAFDVNHVFRERADAMRRLRIERVGII